MASEKSEDFFSKFNGSVFAYLAPIRILRQKLQINKVAFFVINKETLIEMLNCMCFEDKSDPFDDELVFERINNSSKTTIKISEEVFDKSGKIRNISTLQAEDLIHVYEEEVDDSDELPF